LDQQRRGRECADGSADGSGSSWSWSRTGWSAGSPRRSLSPPAGRGGSRAGGTLPGPVRRSRAAGGVPSAGSPVGSPAGGRELLKKGGRIFYLLFFAFDNNSEHPRTKVRLFSIFYIFVNLFQSSVRYPKKLNYSIKENCFVELTHGHVRLNKKPTVSYQLCSNSVLSKDRQPLTFMLIDCLPTCITPGLYSRTVY